MTMTDTTHPAPTASSETTITVPPVTTTNASSLPEVKLDIEHMPVDDDPRKWSDFRKSFVLLQVSVGTMIAGLTSNIQNPSIAQMEQDLNATSSEISWTIALFILLQGCMPLMWSIISEFKGRKAVYVSSLSIFFAASLVVARSTTIELVIGFRCLQAAGSSAVMAIGAATLADIYEPEVRGTKMGIYYMAPLLGPSLGPILGGALTIGFGWRGPFYFLAAVAGLVTLSFLFLYKDTFRRERSLVYQKALKHRLREEAHKDMESKRKSTSSDLDKRASAAEPDVEKQQEMHDKAKDVLPNMKITWKDINPVRPLWRVLRRPNNFCVLLASGLIYAFCFVVSYTTSRTLGTYYHYNALKIGLVLLSFGLGSMAGSILGGRWSDYQLAKLKEANGGKGYPEMRLTSTIHSSILFPIFILGFAWVLDKHVHIAASVVMLFMCGFAVILIYTSTLAYLVDANVGQSSTAVALNSAFRGIAAFIMTEIAVPMQDGLGEGWMYTVFAGIMIICGLLILAVTHKGRDWRSAAEEHEKQSEMKP
ncbi:vacuolar DHA amino acid exporter [Marasmius fiardii PR-910]|nr:vacuolar DHA amino acid exporter [Marasmius fiardii PR-910]